MIETVRVLRGADPEIDRPAWRALAATARETPPQLLPGWQDAWWKHRGHGSERVTIVVERGDVLVGVLPLAIGRSRAGQRIARLAGVDWTCCDGAIVAPERSVEVATRLIDGLAAVPHDAVVWGGLRADAVLGEVLGGRLRRVPRAAAPLLDLDTSWEETFARLMSKRTRQKLVSKWRGLDRLGAVSIEVLDQADDLLARLDEIAAIHHARWESLTAERGVRDRSLFASAAGLAELRDRLAGLAADGAVRVLLVSIDGRPVAFRQYALVGGVLHGERSSFRPELAHYSLGLFAIVRAFEAAIGEGATLANLGHGTDDYKRQLVDRDVAVDRAILAGPGPLGRVTAVALERLYRLRGVAREAGALELTRRLRRARGRQARNEPSNVA